MILRRPGLTVAAFAILAWCIAALLVPARLPAEDELVRTPEEILAEAGEVPSPEAIRELFINCSSWDQEHEEVKEPSKQALIELGALAVPTLLEYLPSTNVLKRVTLDDVIRGIGHPAAEFLVPYLESEDDRTRRHRIEHAQVVSPADIPRFAALGVIASMQPTHATSDMYWAEKRLGSARVQGAYAWRKVMDAGAVIACGSDFPVEAVNPLWGIYSAVTRQDHEGWPEGGWYTEECMTTEEAVRGFTTNAAFAAFAEKRNGTIERGKLADFTIVDRDVFVIAPAKILETRTVYTIVGGEIVYAARDSIDPDTEVP